MRDTLDGCIVQGQYCGTWPAFRVRRTISHEPIDASRP